MKIESLDYAGNAKDYYGSVLSSTADLKTSACCTASAPPAWLKPILAKLPDEVVSRFYGCGSPLPPVLDGATVLDLGCGTGRDIFVAAHLVGPRGRVIGVDFTREQLEVARRNAPAVAKSAGIAEASIEILEGDLAELTTLGIAPGSVDVVISNCVLNLCADKGKVFREIFKVLKPGGELYFSDVFASRRLPVELAHDPVFHGECLGGALYWEDFRRLLVEVGCPDHRVITSTRMTLNNEAMAARSEGIDFDSATVRCFKLASLEDRYEDYGQILTYLGTVPEMPRVFELDPGHRFETGRPERVCGNTASMIEDTRFAPHFEVLGDRRTHFGLFPCAPVAAAAPGEGGCC